MKHYISVEFLSIFGVPSPTAETQSPSIENFLATVLIGPAPGLALGPASARAGPDQWRAGGGANGATASGIQRLK